MTSNVYDVGDCIKLQATFTDENGAAADPTAITLEVLDPSRNKSTYTYALGQVAKDATGVYSKTVTIDESGEWYYRWEGTGALIAADETLIYVRESEFD